MENGLTLSVVLNIVLIVWGILLDLQYSRLKKVTDKTKRSDEDIIRIIGKALRSGNPSWSIRYFPLNKEITIYSQGDVSKINTKLNALYEASNLEYVEKENFVRKIKRVKHDDWS